MKEFTAKEAYKILHKFNEGRIKRISYKNLPSKYTVFVGIKRVVTRYGRDVYDFSVPLLYKENKVEFDEFAKQFTELGFKVFFCEVIIGYPKQNYTSVSVSWHWGHLSKEDRGF